TEGTVAGWVWQNQQARIIHDIEEEFSFPATQALRDRSVRSLCVLPLTTAQQRLGVLSIWSDRPGTYDHQDLEFAQLVAAQIAVPVGAQCYQRKLARERERSALLLELNNTLVSNLNLRELLSAISACLGRVMPHDAAGLALHDPLINKLRVTALEFPTDEEVFVEGEIIELEGTPAGRAFTTRQPVMSGLEHSADPVGKRVGLKSGVTVPLISHDRALGILGVASLHENAFTDDDIELLSQVGKQVAIAVEN